MKGNRKAELITDARIGPGQDRHRREKEYMALQALRIPPLIVCAVCAVLHWWIAAGIAVAITIPLPWIAVMLGNSHGEIRHERERNTYRPGLARQQALQAEQALQAKQALQAEQAHHGQLGAPSRPQLTAGALPDPQLAENTIDHNTIDHED